MDQEVAKTLGELELKLQELERELTTIGHRDTPPEPLHAPGKLVDEAVERSGPIDVDQHSERRNLEDDAFGGPAVFGGEEVPAQGGATIERNWAEEVSETAYGEIPTPSPASSSSPQSPPTPPGPSPTPQSPPIPPPAPTLQSPPSTPPKPSPSSTPAAPTPPGHLSQPPSHPDPRFPAAAEESQSVSLIELVNFRDKLARTMDELIDEYSRILSQEPRSRPRPGA